MKLIHRNRNLVVFEGDIPRVLFDSDSSARSGLGHVVDDMRQRKATWEGLQRRVLEELRTAHDDFRHALSYRSYLLLNTDETLDRHEFSHAHMFRRRVKPTLKDFKFDVCNPIEILQFVRMFKTQCDKNDIAKRAAIKILLHYPVGAAETTYMNELELGNEVVRGISSYCHAVQVLLRHFAADKYMYWGVEEFESVRQREEEDETTYAHSFRAKARCFGAGYPETDIITRSIPGLDRSLNTLLSVERNAGLRSCRMFYDLIDRAAGLGDSQRQYCSRRSAVRKLVI